MKNSLAVLLQKAKHKGVEEGLITGGYVTLVALGNIVDEYIPEDKISEFLKSTEKEMQDVWAETLKYMAEEDKTNKSKMRDQNAFTTGEYLIGHVTALRKKYHMDEVEDEAD